MNKEARKTADRLKKALDNLGVAIKRTHAYDLIAAARGLRNRELLKQSYVMPGEADRDGIILVAARISQQNAETITDCAVAICVPSPLKCTVGDRWRSADFDILIEELEDVEAFLSGPRAEKGVKAIATGMYHTAYYLDRSDGGMDIKTANKLGAEMLDGECRYSVLDEHYGHGRSAYDSVDEQEDEIEKAITALRDLAGDVGAEFDEDEWTEQIKEAVRDHLENEDDSCVTDMLQDSDRAEVMFLFAPKHGYLDDVMIQGHYNYCDADKVQIDHNLQFALSRLGYGIGEFRRITNNCEEGHPDLDPDMRPSPHALLAPGKLRDLIENASSSYFHIGLYLQVPIRELLEVDLDRPLVLRNAHVSAYGMTNGTFYDDVQIPEITVNPEDGRFICIGGRYSPSDICGLYNPPYHGSVSNPPSDEGEVVQMQFPNMEDDQFRLAFAA